MIRTTALSAAAVAIALGISGCSADSNGPLSLGMEKGTLCVPATPGQVVAIGEIARATGEAATIDDVTLINADGLELDEAYLVPIEGDSSIGAAYPEEDPPAAWDSRIPAEGAVVGSGDTVNLVITVSSGDGQGTAESVKVAYESSGKKFVVDGTVQYKLDAVCN